jgi:hypothetical protein
LEEFYGAVAAEAGAVSHDVGSGSGCGGFA